MRVVLSAPIPIARVAVFAEMAWMERRPELGVICRAAQKSGNRISAASVQSVVPGLAAAGASNVTAWCRMLGLCDAQGGLTSLGENVAESDEAPVPEQGVYDFWLAQHPIIGRRILAAERLSASQDQRFESITPLPMEPERDVVFRSVVDPQQRYLLRELPSNHGQTGCLLEPTQATCRLSWTLDFTAKQDRWQLDGAIDVSQGGKKPIQHEAESDGIDLDSLANIWGAGPLRAFGQWQVAERRLAMPLKDLATEEQDSFQKTLQLRQIEVPGKGTYTNVSLEDVPIGPASAQEAALWAVERLERHLARHLAYRSRSEIRRLFAELTEGTPLERFHPTLPTHDIMLREQLHAQKLDVFWSLAAPVDLCLAPISQAELGVFQVGIPSIEVAEKIPARRRQRPSGGEP